MSSNTAPKLDQYISQTEAAALRGISRQAISDLIRRGRLPVTMIAGRKLLLRSDVESFSALSIGRPPKKKAAKKSAKKKA